MFGVFEEQEGGPCVWCAVKEGGEEKSRLKKWPGHVCTSDRRIYFKEK